MLCCVQDKKDTGLEFTPTEDKLDSDSQKAAALESLANTKIAEEQKETAKAKEQIKERDAQIKELQAQLAAMSTAAPLPGDDASNQSEDKDAMIRDLEAQLAETEGHMARMKAAEKELQASTAAKVSRAADTPRAECCWVVRRQRRRRSLRRRCKLRVSRRSLKNAPLRRR